jgi:hypothetical protein
MNEDGVDGTGWSLKSRQQQGSRARRDDEGRPVPVLFLERPQKGEVAGEEGAEAKSMRST